MRWNNLKLHVEDSCLEGGVISSSALFPTNKSYYVKPLRFLYYLSKWHNVANSDCLQVISFMCQFSRNFFDHDFEVILPLFS